METTNSISQISRIITTAGSNPVVVLCDDLNEYVCKYSIGTPAKKLLIEYLGHAFASLWGISVPEGKFVKIASEHVPDEILSNSTQRRYFDIPTIGSLNYPESKEIDRTLVASWKAKKSQLKKVQNKEDLLKIGLFDLWLANEDRNHNNFNLLVNSADGGVKIVAIDHEKCFNSGIINNDRPPYQINGDESILTSDLVPLFFVQNAKLAEHINNILVEFPTYVDICQRELPQILQQLPIEWGINQDEIREFLNNHIFVQSWREETEENFRQLISDSFQQLV